MAPSTRPSLVAPLGLVGGFALARTTHRRPLGGALFALFGLACWRDWYRAAGRPTALALLGVYVAAMGLSHPLARRIGPWPAVLGLAVGFGGASKVLLQGSPPPGRVPPLPSASAR